MMVVYIDNLSTIKEILKIINQDYANVLSTIFSLLLFIVTTMYVIITQRQAKISQQSIELNKIYLQQLEREHKTSVTPTLIPEEIHSHGSGYFGDRRRQLKIKCKLKNIGNSPAFQIYSNTGLNYKYVEVKDYKQLYENSYTGFLAPMSTVEVEMHFETKKVEKLIEDLNITHEKNLFRLENDFHQKSFSGTDLIIEFVYSNIHGQYFKTKYEINILGFDAYKREDENDRKIYFSSKNALKDDEVFRLMLINPIFSHLEIKPVDDTEAEEFITSYKNIYEKHF
jgi:hypothetical protein